MSLAAKATFGSAVVLTTFTVWGVHYIQTRERATMYQGVVKDDARVAAKKLQREAEFAEQIKRQAYLEQVQPISELIEHHAILVMPPVIDDGKSHATVCIDYKQPAAPQTALLCQDRLASGVTLYSISSIRRRR
ncbi:uncharacterized protein L969DRAFT_94219 [Mixia osmundae IAM 14324]|uniref:Uncharacterized protein n=1 Tax=Mixia osmundae (strain CBS 9802 / IAM 14324 / JCM 22182 / KY 12970) TaxID=764103 RepID=G7E6F9_MIXOS|nr:uncharacterized protein L969DRAFT_94219 [Mixia osmundae IAM 14324]KEI40424.1 hypothetical protein L969DRAFT_94219 [Mixia osmundae IAM 14324]GAA98419.1 hypothetical protein E5Q_05105 [Mixia osmundae IAM 14324]